MVLQASIASYRKAELDLKLEFYKQKVDELTAIVARSQADVAGYRDRLAAALKLEQIRQELEQKQIGRVQAVRARRDATAVETALAELRDAAAGDRNLMDPLLDAARAHATEGEIVQALQQVFGTYTETPVF